MKEELMRRISAALDSPDGLAGDPALQEELRGDPAATRYAKDVTRVGKWLATWPLPEPDDAAFEALASRIEQRLDEALPAIADPTAPPTFEDDDAIRDATAGLLQSGEFRVSDSSIELVSDPAISTAAAAPPPPPPPAADAKPALARVALGKARAPAIVEEPSGVELGEPMSSAELELRLGERPKKKKKKKSGASASSDRISIPTPKPLAAAPTLSPVVQLPKAEEKRPATLWWLAAAAAVGLGVFGAATLYETEATPVAEAPHGSTLVTSGAIAPVVPQAAPIAAVPQAAPTEAAPPPPPVAPGTLVAPATAVVAAAEIAAMPSPDDTTLPLEPMRAARHRASAVGSDRFGDDLAEARTRAPMAASAPTPAPSRAGGAGGGAPPATTATTTARSARPTLEDALGASTASATGDTGALPETPDRSTIQAVLAGRLEAVRACAEGEHGLADVDIVIASSGRITTATVNGAFAGTPIGSCIARAVRAATFPPFRQSRFEVTYPYHL